MPINDLPCKLHTIWLQDKPVPYDAFASNNLRILRSHWKSLIWTKFNIPFEGRSRDVLLKLIRTDIEMASLYYKVAILEKEGGFAIGYNVKLNKHLRPLHLLGAKGRGLLVAKEPCDYTGDSYLSTDIFASVRSEHLYNENDLYWPNRLAKWMEDHVIHDSFPRSVSAASLLTYYFSDRSLFTKNTTLKPLVRQDSVSYISSIAVVGSKYFYSGDSDERFGTVYPNLGY